MKKMHKIMRKDSVNAIICFGIAALLCPITINGTLFITSANAGEELPQIKIDQKQLNCLATDIFFEGRNTDYAEMIRISNVVLNRMANEKYPTEACDVINQHQQFSWTLKKTNNMERIVRLINKDEKEKKAWHNAKVIATLALQRRLIDNTKNAISYHYVHMKKPNSSFWKSMKLCLVSPYHKYYAAKS
jgi:spore germination cell wall hydrolase CwlJ-like protein